MKSKQYILVLLVFILSFTGCNDKKDEEIKIGFVAGLSGKYSALGISIRDGFTLAFDEIDNKIDGKKVKIIQKDDKQDENEAKKIIDNFIKNDIKLVVGNATSSMTAVSVSAVNKQKNMLLISATASSSDFTKKDDNFLRIQVEHSDKRYKTLLDYTTQQGYKNIFFIYDSKNLKYTQGYEEIFQDMFVANGRNKFVGKVDLNKPYEEIVQSIKSVKNDLILIVGNSVDSANIIQYIRLNKINTKILGTGWAKTMDFITNGGKAVEGVLFSTGYDDKSKDKSFLDFVEKFKIKYGRVPSVFSAQGYELGQILIKNLRNSTDISTLKQRILTIKKYDGLQGDIIFDKYGDIFREYFIMEVKDSKYIKL
ncbi:MAG: ABC transporter substrate-binding protein [Campylobacterota bacterium]|nr:ABC transporter substrate-binding protein [Campylobacterota bacterium]